MATARTNAKKRVRDGSRGGGQFIKRQERTRTHPVRRPKEVKYSRGSTRKRTYSPKK